MTAAAVGTFETFSPQSGAQPLPVQRHAFYMESGGERIFSWIHLHDQRDSIDHGIIICSPIGHEQIHAHRSLRHLADVLAAQAIPTMRFDWHGTGNSPGLDQDPKRCRAWLTNIRSAAQWMRTHLGCRQVSLIGLRMGATLAAQATLENEIDHLVLWSPVIKGRSYVREMKALCLTAEVVHPTKSSDDIETAGFVLSAETAAELSQLDLTAIQPRCRHTLVVSRADISEDDRLCHIWAAAGIRVQQIAVAGYADMMAIPHRSLVPFPAIEQISEWLVRDFSHDVIVSPTTDGNHEPASVSIQIMDDSASMKLGKRRIRESVWLSHSKPELFGIVSEPRNAIHNRLPTIVLLNAGSVHHVGPNRLNVFLARQLSSVGFRCLRLDLSGLGDSATVATDSEVDPYQEAMFQDIDHVLKQLEHDEGIKRIVLMGLCSGAYAAFQAAVMLKRPALVESVLINPLTYFWTEGMSIDDSPTKHLRLFHYYKKALFDPRKWLKFLSGNSQIGLGGAMRLMARKLKLAEPAVRRSTSENRRATNEQLAHPQHEDLPADLQRIVEANRTLAMFFSTTDPGYEILNHYARKQVKQLRRKGLLAVGFVDGADHTFTPSAARNDLIAAVTRHLQKRFD